MTDIEILDQDRLNIILILVLIGLTALTAIGMAIYYFAHKDIMFTMVPQGEIVVIMHGDRVARFIGNITGYWVHPKTGIVTEGNAPTSISLPGNIYGIYWIGLWPFASRYKYMFPRTKYSKGTDGATDYTIHGKNDRADSIFWQASFGITVRGAETEEGIPITADFVITTRTVDANKSLFGNKSPGWLANANGSVTAEIRDIFGTSKLNEIIQMEAEVGTDEPKKDEGGENTPKVHVRSRLQKGIALLNDSDRGNPGIKSTLGQEIVSVNFLGFSIDPTDKMSDTQKASLTKYYADRDKEKVETAAEAKSKEMRILADAKLYEAQKEAEAIKVKGNAEAQAAKQMADATKENPHAGLQSLGNSKSIHTVVIGTPAMPAFGISPGTAGEKPGNN